MTRSKFNLGFGIKEPNLVESFSSNPYFRGNPDLKPERTSGVEVGVEQRLWDDRVKAEVSFFYDRIHNQIELQTTDFQTYEAAYFNLGESRVWGVEHQVRLLRQGPLELSCSYTYLNSRILKSYAPFNPVLREGRPLLRRPSHSGSISAGWRTKRWNVSSTLDMVGRRGDLEYFGLGLDQVAGYASWEAAGAVVLSPHVELYVLARNLLNRRYSETIGYAALKFNTRTGLRFSF
jgi:vitamin B12 transporter